MAGEAVAVAHGAATIVNAIALGRGAAFGVDMYTKAEVKLTGESGVFEVEITSDPNESTLLVERTVARVLERFKAQEQYGAKVKTTSNIPAARGLKSSSVAANATALATIAALEKSLDDIEIVRISVEAAFDAKCTITGAFDDACASYFGGAVITDNTRRQILKQLRLPKNLSVLFWVPAQKAYTINSDVDRLQTVKPLVELAFEKAMMGSVWDALTLNGLVYSAASGQNPAIAIDALQAGAVAAGLCGKGPAVTAVVHSDTADKVKAALQNYEGNVIEAQLNGEKAKVF